MKIVLLALSCFTIIIPVVMTSIYALSLLVKQVKPPKKSLVSQVTLSLIDKLGKPFVEAKELADKGDGSAQFKVAFAYRDSSRDKIETEEEILIISREYFKKAAFNPSNSKEVRSEALFQLGNLYDSDVEYKHEKKPTKAFYYYELATQQNHARAGHNLGLSYIKGQGVAQDVKTGINYLEGAAALGSRVASYSLGRRYYKGEEVAQDKERGKEYLKLAGAQGCVRAKRYLGQLEKLEKQENMKQAYLKKIKKITT